MARSPLQAIRAKCLDCCLGSTSEVKLCPSETCPLHALRFGRRVEGASPLKAIRRYCLGCGEGTWLSAKNCPFTDCPLYPFRFGTNPNISPRKLSDSERKALVERMATGREAKSAG